MEFGIIGEEIFREFLKTHPLRTFLQSPEIAKIRSESGWNIEYVGLKNNQKLVAAVMLASKKNGLKYEYYAIRGPLVDFNDEELTRTFFKYLKKYIKRKGAYILRIDPYIKAIDRDIDGKIIEGGINNYHIVNLIKSLGFKKSKVDEQVRWVFVLDIENKTEEEIFKNMKPNTRNFISQSSKNGVIIEEISYDDLHKFKSLTQSTSDRIGFVDRKLSYYQQMYKMFKPRDEIKFFLAKLDLNFYINKLYNDLEKQKYLLDKYDKKNYKDNTKDIENTKKAMSNIESRLEVANDLKDKNGNYLNLSATMFICNCDELVYLFSGNYDKYMKFNGQYAIQGMMIKYAIENNYKRYNFYGIPNDICSNPKSYESGNYKFKKGFNGVVEELIGEYECSFGIYYYIYNLLLNIKNIIRR